MYLKRLVLTNFRNYVRLSLELPRAITILYGANAQGKTNLLEAIYYLTTARSPYAGSDVQLVNWLADQDDLPHMRIEAELVRAKTSTRIEIVLTRAPGQGNGYRKHVRVNGIPRRVTELPGEANIVLFCPQDVSLVDGPPVRRRRYLNALLCQIDAEYCRALSQYNRVLERRNHLLRNLRERGGQRDQLEFWDQKLAQEGALIVARRQRAVIEIEALAQAIHRELSGGNERLRLRYLPGVDLKGDEPQLRLELNLTPPVSIPREPEEIAHAFLKQLHAARGEEIGRGATLIGPHRDDLRMFDGRIDLHLYGSRGQQRTAVLALKLAEVSLVARNTGEQPILLLDEVMAELDVERRRYLCRQVMQVEQSIITGADIHSLPPEILERANIYQVVQGRILRTTHGNPNQAGT